MPTITVQRTISTQDVINALSEQLGSGYEFTSHMSGPQEALKVKHGAASTATVRLSHDNNVTTFHIHGGGLLVSRLVNELGVAKKVAAAVAAAFPPGVPVDVNQGQDAQ